MSDQIELAVGTIVKLKSGGPEMTVQKVPSKVDLYYTCQWFAGKKLESGRFPSDSLELIKIEK